MRRGGERRRREEEARGGEGTDLRHQRGDVVHQSGDEHRVRVGAATDVVGGGHAEGVVSVLGQAVEREARLEPRVHGHPGEGRRRLWRLPRLALVAARLAANVDVDHLEVGELELVPAMQRSAQCSVDRKRIGRVALQTVAGFSGGLHEV